VSAAQPPKAFVAVLVIHLHFPEAESLKAKRKELAPVKAHLQGKLGAALAEVEHQDRWQRATLVAALTAESTTRLSGACDIVERWLDGRFPQGVRVDRTIASVSDLYN
jgi:uncharacterized protein YlxP (DUF503 family)